MECYCSLRNIQDLLAEGKTPCERFVEPFKGTIIPFGAMVDDHSISVRHKSRVHQCGKKLIPGIFLGYELVAVRIWIGDHSGCGLGRIGKVGHIR